MCYQINQRNNKVFFKLIRLTTQKGTTVDSRYLDLAYLE